MKIMKLESPEFRLAELIWKNEPLSSDEIVKLCEAELFWKKSKIEAELKKLYKRRIFQIQEGIVTSMISYEDYCARLGELNNGMGKNQDATIGFVGASTDRTRLW